MVLPGGFDPPFPPYQSGALPNRRRERSPMEESNPIAAVQRARPPLTESGKMEPPGGIRPPSRPYAGRVLSLNYGGENGQTDGASAQHPEGGGRTGAVQFWTFTMPNISGGKEF